MRYGLQNIDQKISSLLRPIFQGSKKEFILINNLVKNWQDIVGTKYVKFCYPKTVSFDKEGSAKLTIAVHNSAAGFFLENNGDLIIERIASFYGFKSIAKIIIKQEPKDIATKREEIVLPKNQEDFLQGKLGNIADKGLAEALQNLGREIMVEK
jgi:hypothetical protein